MVLAQSYHFVPISYHHHWQDPWPIFIEDFHGRTHEIILTPGDIVSILWSTVAGLILPGLDGPNRTYTLTFSYV